MLKNTEIFGGVYKGAKVLITGHTGFKGSWLALWLSQLGADVYGISIDIPTKESNFIASDISSLIHDVRLDITDLTKLTETVEKIQPDFIFHLAAQALVGNAHKYPVDTISTNLMGSVNIMEAVRHSNKKICLIMITSDKVYDNVEWCWGYKETDLIGGKDPYSSSKGMAELAIKTYFQTYFKFNENIKIAIARAGNVIGGGDWALDRIVPDCVQAWSQKKCVNIRSPKSTRPWQHVLEPLSGYLLLGEKLLSNSIESGSSYNFGPSEQNNRSVGELIDKFTSSWPSAKWEDVSSMDKQFSEATLLKLNCEKAYFDLSWASSLNFDQTVRMTLSWYLYYYKDNKQMQEYSIRQINEYIGLSIKKKILWAIS